MRISDDRETGWYGPADRYDVLWGVVVAILLIAGAAVLLFGQAPVYRLALRIGGAS